MSYILLYLISIPICFKLANYDNTYSVSMFLLQFVGSLYCICFGCIDTGSDENKHCIFCGTVNQFDRPVLLDWISDFGIILAFPVLAICAFLYGGVEATIEYWRSK